MPKGSTASPYAKEVRIERAYQLYSRGYSITQVARELGVSPNTASRYKQEYERQIKLAADAQPELLQDVLTNTLRNLVELDQIREEASKNYERAKTDSAKQGYLRIMLDAQKKRIELYGLLGVKTEVLVQIAKVRDMQKHLLEFMRYQLCSDDREKLEKFILQKFNNEAKAIES